VLAHFGVVIGILAAGGLAIWAYGNGAVFLYHHWPWVIAGVCILLLAGRLIGKRNKG
jgi:hypothetical protein